MPPSYRRRYYNYYRPSSGYSRWTRYSSRTTGRAKRRAIGNLIAANAQKDATQVNLSITTKCAVKDTTTNINGTNFQSGAFAINVWDLLRRSEFYQSYANMYDQVKIDSIKVKLTPVQWTFNSSLTNNHMNSAITIGTAWDRTGLSKEQLIKSLSQFTSTKPTLGTEENSDGIYLNIGEDIWTYSSLITRNLNPGSSVNLNRALYPSSISEKGFYVNTSELKQWYEQYDYNKCRYYGIIEPDYVAVVPNVGGEVIKTDAVPTNPCYLQEDSTIPFKPTLLIGVRGGVLGGDAYIPVNDRATKKLYGKEAETVISPVIFNVDFDVGVTFRGLRKAPIVA
jgi:hypothetical protein